MRCKQCSYTAPYNPSSDGECLSCGAKMVTTAEDWLSQPEMGLVKEVRPGQIVLANIIEESVQSSESRMVVAQGGCGLGKSFAYLIPSILSGRRVIVSTAKKSLQGQLAAKDLPYLQEVLSRPRTFVSVKGRGNYLCKVQLDRRRDTEFQFEQGLHKRLRDFLSKHPSGDLDAFTGGVHPPTSFCKATECIGRSCTHATDCGYRKVKGRAKVSEVVIVNHALLGFDLKFGPCRLLGEYDILIIDEAHAAENYFRNAFSYEISTSWMGKTLSELNKLNVGLSKAEEATARKEWKSIFKHVPDTDTLGHGFFGDLTVMRASFDTLLMAVDTYVATHWPPMGTVNLRNELEVEAALGKVGTSEHNEVLLYLRAANKVDEMKQTLAASEDPDDNMIRVREESRGKKDGFKVVMKPIDIGRLVGPALKSINTVVLTSATLQANLLQRDLGIQATTVVDEPSPFNYKANGLVYIPKTVPNPATARVNDNYDGWVAAIARETHQLVDASGGNGLILFTSIKEMQDVYTYLDENYGFNYPVFAQEAGRRPDEVFQEYMDTDDAVLFGSKSFFEGIDVQGDKLRLVVLTKLPFPIWGDPVVQAKKVQLGNEHFSQYYLPKMFVDLMQAAGRLIRTKNDRGVFAVLDVRMWVGQSKTKNPEHVKVFKGTWPGYGGKAFQQLPFSNVTPDFALTQRFLKHVRGL